MCEVLRSNFEDLFPKIEAAIVNAEFLGKKLTVSHPLATSTSRPR